MILLPDTCPLGVDLWRELFDNDAPVSVEIGPGTGEFLVTTARRTPERNLFGIERSFTRAGALERRLAELELRNARILWADAACVLTLLPDASVDGYFVQFPDPWWKRRHQRRRIWTVDFVADLRRTLVPGATIDLITDVPTTFAAAEKLLGADAGLERVLSGPTAHAATNFARKALNRGDALFRSVYRRRESGDTTASQVVE
jgi:tRNA (guanine-N7-)-methyltransferase